ncbi:MAG: hypothetical protein Q9181_002171 [Wetmoreana brouardii]
MTDHPLTAILKAGQPPVIAASRASSLSVPKSSSTTLSETIHKSPTNEPDSPQIATGAGSEDLDGLIGRLDRAKIETAAPGTSRVLKVPKGYALGMGFDISRFYDLRSDFRKLDKRKRDLGVIPMLTGRQKHGFRPEELLWYGAIDLKDCKDSNLSNDVHPLLQRNCFDDTPDHVYDQLIPGLRLASLFLSHPACMQFWVTLAKGERRVDHEMSRRCGTTRHRISRNVPMTEENVSEVIGYIKSLGEAKAFHFTFADGLTFRGEAAFGTACTVCDYKSEGRQTDSVQRCNIRLHSDFYVIAKKLSTMSYPDFAQKLRFNFIFATLVVHELAHAIELSQWRNRAPSPYEPFLLHHNEAELGRMWECYIFGGQVAPINDRCDGVFGISTWNWPRTFGEWDPERTICYALPMKYIEDLQHMETWDQKQDNIRSRSFHIPRDGATSVYMNSVTTVSWTEEERVAKEALNEQYILELEEPARKRRAAADGHAVGIKTAAPTDLEIIEKPAAVSKGEPTVQPVHRVKIQPRSVLSRKQKRQQKKLEQKYLETEQHEQRRGQSLVTEPSLAGKDREVNGKLSRSATKSSDGKRTVDDIGVVDGKSADQGNTDEELNKRRASNQT